MTLNKKLPSADPVEHFLTGITDADRQSEARVLLALMQQVTSAPATLWGDDIIGFGQRQYEVKEGHQTVTLAVGFSPQKSAIVVYGLDISDAAAALLDELGPVTADDGCLYIKRLKDVKTGLLSEMIGLAYHENNIG